MPWEETENEIRHRVRDPEDFQPDSFRTITLKEDKPRVFAIIGKLKGETTTTIQALRFPKEDGWTLEKAKEWVAKHFKKHHGGGFQLEPASVERLALAPADAVRPATVDRTSRRFIARALSGQPIRRYDPSMGGEVLLVFEPSGCDLTRFKSGVAPLLDGHRAEAGITAQLGAVVAAWFEGSALFVQCQLSSRPEVNSVLDDLAAGVLRGVSLGVEVQESRIERNAAGPPLRIITRWMPYEVSLVPVPADPGAVVLSLAKEEVSVQKQNLDENFDAPAAAAAAERERVIQLTKLGKTLGVGEEFVLHHIEAGTSVEEFRRQAQQELVRRYEQAPTHSHVAFVTDEGDLKREGLALALWHRMRGGEPDERAKPYLHLRLADAARECLRWRGVHLAGMSDARVVQLAMTTSDFPNILANVANKTLLDAYQASPSALKRICRVVSAADFKERRVLRFGEGTGLQYKAEGASYTYGAIAEQVSSYQVKSYGRVFAVSREMIINDDLGAMDQFFRSAGRLATEFEARLLADLLTANNGTGPILADGLPLFHSTRGNLASSGGAISVATLGAARAALRRMKGLDGGIIIDADPRFLIVPVAQQTLGEQVTTEITPAQPSDVNPFAGRLTVLADPHLDDASTTAWYLAADPANIPTFELAYLEGTNGPQTETESDFDHDVLKFKVRLDVGAGVVDWRGIYRNPGA
jgi:hypothetical protein